MCSDDQKGEGEGTKGWQATKHFSARLYIFSGAIAGARTIFRGRLSRRQQRLPVPPAKVSAGRAPQLDTENVCASLTNSRIPPVTRLSPMTPLTSLHHDNISPTHVAVAHLADEAPKSVSPQSVLRLTSSSARARRYHVTVEWLAITYYFISYQPRVFEKQQRAVRISTADFFGRAASLSYLEFAPAWIFDASTVGAV